MQLYNFLYKLYLQFGLPRLYKPARTLQGRMTHHWQNAIFTLPSMECSYTFWRLHLSRDKKALKCWWFDFLDIRHRTPRQCEKKDLQMVQLEQGVMKDAFQHPNPHENGIHLFVKGINLCPVMKWPHCIIVMNIIRRFLTKNGSWFL